MKNIQKKHLRHTNTEKQSQSSITSYAPVEERINIVSHAIGALAGIAALILLITKAVGSNDLRRLIGFSVYGISIILLYTASALYHSRKDPSARKLFKVFDHAAIFLLIAGTYTPFTLISLAGTIGWIIFGIVWGFAISGVLLKVFLVGKARVLSAILYVCLGWVVIFVIRPLSEALPREGLYWLIGGGAAYTFGAVLYIIRRMPYNHALFHLFVLLGSLCHFISIYQYV